MKSTRIVAHPVASFKHSGRLRTQRSAWWAGALVLAATFGLATGTNTSAQAQSFTVLHTFAGYPTDGGNPEAGLLMDAAGNLYGTTRHGGNNDSSCTDSGIGCGTVFKLDVKGKETVLHNFSGLDGANPLASVIMDAKGDLYGTTRFGGRLQDCADSGGAGCGVVFKLSGSKETVLHRFCSVGDCEDGAEPWGGVVMDASGALYSTTYFGGSSNGGVVFKLVGKKETVLHSFTGAMDGAFPTAGLIMDAKEHLYGTATSGGDFNCGCGVVFKLARKKMTVLHAFKGSPDGDTPVAALFMDAGGNLYGTTADGGSSDNRGTVFEVSRGGKEHVLYRFTPQHNDGFRPQSRVIRDADGNLYGTTLEGGDAGDGIVFEVTKDGEATPSVSSNGTTARSGIVWAIENQNANNVPPTPNCNSTTTFEPAALHAFDATSVNSGELYSSRAVTTKIGGARGFPTPTIFQDQVYMGTTWGPLHNRPEVDVFGLCSTNVNNNGQCLP